MNTHAAVQWSADLRMVVEMTPSPQMLLGGDGVILLANPPAALCFGYDAADQLTGLPGEALLAPKSHGAALSESGEKWGLTKAGGEICIDISTRSFGWHTLVAITDVTALRKAEERFQLVIESAPSGRVLANNRGLITLVNSRTEAIFGFEPGELLGKPLEILVPDRMKEAHPRLRSDFFAAPEARGMGTGRDLYGRRKDGSEVPIEIGLHPIRIDDEAFVMATILDITERKKLEERKAVEIALRESEQSLRLLAEALPNIVWTTTPEGEVTYYNRRWYEETGLNPGDDASKGRSLFLDEEVAEYRELMAKARQDSVGLEMQIRRYNPREGIHRWNLIRVVPAFDERGAVTQWIGSSTDIHAQKESEAALERAVAERTGQLEQALSEKTVLLKEVHHRVKNNLAVMASMLARKAESTLDAGGRASLEDSGRRIHAMAMVHEHLYSAGKLDRLDYDVHLSQLSREIHESMRLNTRIELRLNCVPVELGVHRAIPCSLILTELLSNALKYAFPENRPGQVEVSLALCGEGDFRLSVSDNGVGLPSDFDWTKPKSLGLRIVQILTKQLDGTMNVTSGNGCRFELVAPVTGSTSG